MNGQRLRVVRELRGFGLRRLSEEVGISKGHLSRVESGERDMSAETIGKVAKVLGVPIASLVDDKEEIVA